jgi:hypothetical protein
MMFRSSRHDAGAFGASEMPEPTGHGAHELALTIIGRNSPATVDTADHRSVSHGLIQRSHAVDYIAPTMNAPGVPASALAASSQSPLHEVAIERPLSRGAQGRGVHGDIYVFRKQARGGPVLRDQSIETLAPPIGQVSELPMIQTEALNVPASEPRSEPAPAADVNAGSSTQSVGGMDIDELVERVSRRLSRQLAIEHERRGAPTWR